MLQLLAIQERARAVVLRLILCGRRRAATLGKLSPASGPTDGTDKEDTHGLPKFLFYRLVLDGQDSSVQIRKRQLLVKLPCNPGVLKRVDGTIPGALILLAQKADQMLRLR